jgi:pimeloyl-ACP methyl ester carboxylesterase
MLPALRALLPLALTVATIAPATAKPAPAKPAGARPLVLDPELTTYAYPFPVAFHDLTSQRQVVRMAYLDVAPTGAPNGRTALLLHGKNFSAAYWAPTIRALAAAGFRVIAPDQVGFGKSTKPEHYQFSFAQLAANTASLLDTLGVKDAAVVGHSMGGMLAIRFTLMYPARVTHLALLNPIGLEDWAAVVPYATVDQLFAKELEATPGSIKKYQQAAYYGGRWKPEYDALMEVLAGWTRHRDYARVAWNAALTAEMIVTQPVIHDLERIARPTLLVIGQRDRTAIGKERAAPDVAKTLGDYPALGKKAAARIPGARLVELAGVGHLPQVEAFERTRDALLGFLAAK